MEVGSVLVDPHLLTHSRRLRILSRRMDEARSKELLDSRVAKAKVVALNKDIARYAKEKNLQRALECFHFAVSNQTANSHTYSAMINAFVRCGQIEQAFEIYETLKSNSTSVRLDVISCTTIMKGFCGQGDIQSSKRVIQDMLSARPKVIPNIRTINTFLRGCVLAGALQEAEEIFPRIQHEFNVTPDISSWEYLVTLLCQGLAIDKILPIIGRLRNDKSLSGGVAAMCVNLSRAAAILTELKICRKYLTLASQLLEDDEELQLSVSPESLTEPVKLSLKQSTGGKQAWKQNDPDDARAQSLEVDSPYSHQ
jgi:pentatricopeptide repeat protein